MQRTLCEHLAKFQLILRWIWGACFHPLCGFSCVVSLIALGAQELSHLQKSQTKAHLTTLNLMEVKEFTLKYKLGHDPSRARVPPADSPGNK